MLEDFFKNVINLKKVKRQGWVTKLQIDGESVADHTYSMSVIGMIMADILRLDFEKIQRMILLHDLAESIIGDHIPDSIPKVQKRQKEDDVIRSMFADIPKELADKYLSAWCEYLQNETEEAKLVHEIDQFEMALQALDYTSIREKKSVQEFIDYAKRRINNAMLQSLINSTEVKLANEYRRKG